ncbi:MAG: ABC transporter ATP-binding protein [Planctomycetaceae bacterium]|nr:ABC transporter ATP-binding protein [Planctomycetales bacterium]MCB9940677.1 ABC transporter ATP-binding protein [Planctomycetaceae bacterium]
MTSLLQLRQVTHFYGNVCALRDVNLEIEPGAIGLIGQNGAGKSTMMQILLGLIRPTQGTATVLGHDVRTAGIRLRGRVGFMPERDSILPGLNGIEYVALAGELCGMPRRQAMRRAHETLSYLGMEDARYRRLEQYSVGMSQRLRLAATLVHDPDLLLLDEPTAGLDPEGRAAMLALLDTLATRPGKSLVLSSHLLGDIERVCTSAIILNQGQVVGKGRLDELRAQRQQCYQLHWEGDATNFLAALRQRGVDVQVDNRRDQARAIVPDGWKTRLFFADACEHSVLLTGLVPEEEDLEAVYHRTINSSEASERVAPRSAV